MTTKKKTLPEELWICRKMEHLPKHDGATGYFYYDPLEKVDPAQRQSSAVEGLIYALGIAKRDARNWYSSKEAAENIIECIDKYIKAYEQEKLQK